MNNRVGGSAILILCFFSVFVLSVEEKQPQRPNLSFPELLRRAFSFSAGATNNWDRAKTIINRAQAYFFPPNLDFRGSNSDSAREKMDTVEAGEKVKEAVAESLGKMKATVENSAKSAAKIASETVHKAKEKVKKCLFERREQSDHRVREL